MGRFVALTAAASLLAGANGQCTPLGEAAASAGLTSLVGAVDRVKDEAGAAPVLAAMSATEPLATPITLFAPNNAAFEEISTVVDSLTPAQVLGVLSNHVVPSKLDAAAVTAAIEDASPNPAEVTTLGGTTLEATSDGEGIIVVPKNTEIMAMVVTVDVETCAGVVHVIDKVLVPTATSEAKEADEETGAEPAAATCAEAVGASIVNQCHGPAAAQKLPCCSQMAQCVLKSDNYGQCHPLTAKIPEGWIGTIVKYDAPTTTPEATETTGSADTEEAAATTGTEATGSDAAGTETTAPDATATTTTVAVKYTAYAGKDYIPGEANAVMVEDIELPEGHKVVADQKECEEFCSATEGCNAASFYSELVGGNNCWLKTIAEACALPSDAADNEKATLLLKCDKCTPLGEAAMAAGLTSLVGAIDGVKDLAGATPVLAAVGATEPVAEPISLFAPNNDAFAAISTVVEGLTPEQVLAVLANHVVASELDKAAVTAAIEGASPNPAEVTTLGGNMLEVSLMTEDIVVAPKDTDVMAKVAVVDVQTCAGVVHVIDSVLVPSSLSAAAAAEPPAAEGPATTDTTTDPATTSDRSTTSGTTSTDTTGATSSVAGVAGAIVAVAVTAAVAAF